jgi:hypothetical protein
LRPNAPDPNPVVDPSLHIGGITAETHVIRMLGENRRYLVIQPRGIVPATVPHWDFIHEVDDRCTD